MASSWFQDLDQKLDEQLEAFLRSNPGQRQRLEQQERHERAQWLCKRHRQLQATAQKRRSELLHLAEEIARWRERMDRAERASASDLADRATDHLMSLIAQGREHWQSLAALGDEISRLEEDISELAAPAETQQVRDGSQKGRESLDDAWRRFEADQDLEALRRQQA